MGLLNKFRKKKYFRYELQVNDGSGWKKYGDFSEYLDYEDIENPDPGAILKLYGVYHDSSKKEGFGKKSLWEHEVPTPGGKKEKGEKGEREKPIEERLMEKIVESADFSGLKPSKMSLPFGKTGGALEFESPVVVPGSGDGGGYIVIDGNRYPMGGIPPLEFEGKLPAWLHPAAGAMIMGLVDKFGGMIKSSIGDAISHTTGIKAKEEPASEGFAKKEGEVKPTEEPPDLVDDLDNLLSEGEGEKNVEVRKEKKKVK